MREPVLQACWLSDIAPGLPRASDDGDAQSANLTDRPSNRVAVTMAHPELFTSRRRNFRQNGRAVG